jgi:integrase
VPFEYRLEHIADSKYIFEAPRPKSPDLKVGHEASKWFSRFYRSPRCGVARVAHELRHTWIEAARHGPVKKEIYEVISGHSAKTGSDAYGGERAPDVMAANEQICQDLLDPEMRQAILRLVSR